MTMKNEKRHLVTTLTKRKTFLGIMMATILLLSAYAMMPMAEAASDTRTVTVKITRVIELDDPDGWGRGDGDYYSRIIIDGKKKVSDEISKEDFKPKDWEFTKEISATKRVVPINIELWDDDLGGDDHMDINPKKNQKNLHLTYDLVTKKWSGDISYPQTSAQGDGKNKSKIYFEITSTPPDSDGDGLLDDQDRCPNEKGTSKNGGCPRSDIDNDGISDDADWCPNEKGPKNTHGCPNFVAGNGTPNHEVTVKITRVIELDDPDGWFKGDGDYYSKIIIDGKKKTSGDIEGEDFAPNWTFTKEIPVTKSIIPISIGLWDEDITWDDHMDINPVKGKKDLYLKYDLATKKWFGDISYPQASAQGDEKEKSKIYFEITSKPSDKDGDGIPDYRDMCPKDEGPSKYDGCPDTDGDGIHDGKDKCITKAGPSKYDGCPDTDGDRIPDNIDRCDTEPGPKSNNGCPIDPITSVSAEEIKSKLRDTLTNPFTRIGENPGKENIRVVSALDNSREITLTGNGNSDSSAIIRAEIPWIYGQGCWVGDSTCKTEFVQDQRITIYYDFKVECTENKLSMKSIDFSSSIDSKLKAGLIGSTIRYSSLSSGSCVDFKVERNGDITVTGSNTSDSTDTPLSFTPDWNDDGKEDSDDGDPLVFSLTEKPTNVIRNWPEQHKSFLTEFDLYSTGENVTLSRTPSDGTMTLFLDLDGDLKLSDGTEWLYDQHENVYQILSRPMIDSNQNGWFDYQDDLWSIAMVKDGNKYYPASELGIVAFNWSNHSKGHGDMFGENRQYSDCLYEGKYVYPECVSVSDQHFAITSHNQNSILINDGRALDSFGSVMGHLDTSENKTRQTP